MQSEEAGKNKAAGMQLLDFQKCVSMAASNLQGHTMEGHGDTLAVSVLVMVIPWQ